MEYVYLPSGHENVEFEFLGDGTLYRIRLHIFREMMYANIYADNDEVVNGVRCVSGSFLIPSGRLPEHGNFMFVVNGDSYPWWEDFNNGTTLVYYSPGETP